MESKYEWWKQGINRETANNNYAIRADEKELLLTNCPITNDFRTKHCWQFDYLHFALLIYIWYSARVVDDFEGVLLLFWDIYLFVVFFNSIFVVLLVDRFLLLLLFRKRQNFSKDNFNAQFLRLLSFASVKCAAFWAVLSNAK